MSSRSRHDFGVYFSTHGAPQVLSALARMNYGLSQTGTTAMRTGRNMSVLDQQMRAFGTTMRYAFAASVTFGILAQASALRDYYDQLSRVVGLLPETANIDRFAQQIGQAGIEAGIGFDAMTQGASALLQIMPDLSNVPANVLPEITSQIAQSTTLLETTTEELARGIGTTLSPEQMIDPQQWRLELARQFKLVSATQFSGRDLATYLGQISPFASILNVSRPELFAMLEVMARGGGPAAINIRHLRQLMTQIISPSKETAETLAGMGLDQQTISQMVSTPGGFLEILNRIFNEVSRRGGISDVRKMSEEDIAAAEELLAQGNVAGAAAISGVTGAGATFLLDLFGRVESTRAIATLFQQTRSDPTLLDRLIRQYGDINKLVGDLEKSQKRVRDQRFIQSMTEQIAEFRRSVFRDLEPATRAAAGFIQEMFRKATQDMPGGPLAALGVGAGGILAAILGGRALGRRFPGGILGRMFGGGAAGTLGRFGGPLAIAALQAGGPAPDGSIGNPIWVMIHPASWAALGGGGGGILGGGRGGGRTGRFGRFMRGAGRLLGVAGLGYLAYDFLANTEDANAAIRPEYTSASDELRRRFPGFHRLTQAPFGGGTVGAGPVWAKFVRAFETGGLAGASKFRSDYMSGQQAILERAARAFETASHVTGSRTGKTEVTVRLDATPELLKLVSVGIQKGANTVGSAIAGVPAAAWQGGAFPTSRGRQTSMRSERG